MNATKQQIENVLAAKSEFEGLTIRDVFTEGAPMEDIVRMVLNAQQETVNPYERLIDECTYEIINAMTHGKGLRLAMQAVFSRMHNYFTETLGYEKPQPKTTAISGKQYVELCDHAGVIAARKNGLRVERKHRYTGNWFEARGFPCGGWNAYFANGGRARSVEIKP